jgi:hypothetical protein
MEIKALLFWYCSRGNALSEDWLYRVPLGLLRLRLVMTLPFVFARFGTNRSNLLWAQEAHLGITCNRLPMRNIWHILILFVLQACMQKNETKTNYYYDVEAKVLEQIHNLQKSKQIFYKTTKADGKEEAKELQHIDWEKELSFFLQANINKSAFRGLYEETETEKGDTLFKTYIAKDVNLKVEKLVIGLSKTHQDFWSMEAKIRTDNYLYSSQRELRMLCSDKQIISYHIRGKQKMIFSEPEFFEIKAHKK